MFHGICVLDDLVVSFSYSEVMKNMEQTEKY